jgi:hypothetical protein
MLVHDIPPEYCRDHCVSDPEDFSGCGSDLDQKGAAERLQYRRVPWSALPSEFEDVPLVSPTP